MALSEPSDHSGSSISQAQRPRAADMLDAPLRDYSDRILRVTRDTAPSALLASSLLPLRCQALGLMALLCDILAARVREPGDPLHASQHHCLLLILPLLSSLQAGELLHGGEEVDVLRQGICNRGLDHTRPVSDCGYPQTPCTHNTHMLVNSTAPWPRPVGVGAGSSQAKQFIDPGTYSQAVF